MLYHAYEKGFHTLGRQTLIEPIHWTSDGWLKSGLSTDGAEPIDDLCADGKVATLSLSDDFSSTTLSPQWRFWGECDFSRFNVGDGSLILDGKGQSPADSFPLTCVARDHSYEIEVDIESHGGGAGLILFYNPNCFAGLIVDENGVRITGHAFGDGWKIADAPARTSLRLVNDRHEVDFLVRVEGQWRRFFSIESSGFNHNTFGGFVSLRPALFSCGKGKAVFRRFRYRVLDA
jgi:xylan 1,4-beta-xylosidase